MGQHEMLGVVLLRAALRLPLCPAGQCTIMTQFKPFNRSKPCRHGTFVFNVHDVYIGRSLDLYGEWSEGEISFFRQVIGPGTVIVEVGANIGSHTVPLAQMAGPGGWVLAFEPQRILYQTLCANLALNNIPNVDGRNVAVGKEAGKIIVPALDYHRDNNFGGVALEGQKSGERVPLITVDSLGLDKCDLLKVDVEGMEQDVVEGAIATINRCRPLLYVENDRQEKAPALIRTIDKLGYDMYWHFPPIFSPDNFAGNAENVFGTTVSINMICCPRGGKFAMKGFRQVEVSP
jgi:FkbM family methyltransferase